MSHAENNASSGIAQEDAANTQSQTDICWQGFHAHLGVLACLACTATFKHLRNTRRQPHTRSTMPQYNASPTTLWLRTCTHRSTIIGTLSIAPPRPKKMTKKPSAHASYRFPSMPLAIHHLELLDVACHQCQRSPLKSLDRGSL